MKKIIFISIFFMILFLNINSQEQSLIQSTLINGYQNKISGTDFEYHSSIPHVNKSMLIRATDGRFSMEWETQKIPSALDTEYVTFMWLAGIGSSPGLAKFDLSVNDKYKFYFWTDSKDQWIYKNTEGMTLEFISDKTDQHGDKFGFMFLKIPRSKLKNNNPVIIKIRGEKFDLTSWYMTFKLPIQNRILIKSYPAIFNEKGKSVQLGLAEIFNFTKSGEGRLYLNGKKIKNINLKFGHNYCKIGLPLGHKTETFKLKVVTDFFKKEIKFKKKPVKKWRVNLVQHTHTDIGYTRPQTEILPEHLRYIDYALDYCDQTDSYPDAAKFRWTCETSWPVMEYLKSRPKAQVQRLVKRVMEGRIELTGMYLNYSEIPDEQTLAASLKPLAEFKKLKLPCLVAMQNDINGIGWCFPDYFVPAGTKYLNMGTHGHKALICFDKPTLFWWQSPGGEKMLAYRGEHYMTGNIKFHIQTGDFDVFADNLLNYLLELNQKGYLYDTISIQYSGYQTDNSPPSTVSSEIVKKWNSTFIWPKLKIATAAEFFEEIEEKYSDKIPTYRAHWPDWWTDGFGSAAREVAVCREAQSMQAINAAGMTMSVLQGALLPDGIINRFNEINNTLLFYGEHTLGYSESIREPFHKSTMEQRALKESYAWEAIRRTKMMSEEAAGLLQSFVKKEQKPSLMIYNTLSWPRNGLVELYIDFHTIPRDTKFTIIDKNGETVQKQLIKQRPDGAYWKLWVKNIPEFGYKKYQINVLEKSVIKDEKSQKIDQIIENQWYKIKIDYKRAVISSLYDKEINQELIDHHSRWKLGEFIYETLANREQLEFFGLKDYLRKAPVNISFKGFSQGEIYDTLTFTGKTKAAIEEGTFLIDLRVFNTCKRIDLVYFLDKRPEVRPEGIYIALPFLLKNGKHYIEVAGGIMQAGEDQIPGSANDWNSIQSFTLVRNKKSQIIVGSREAPLFQLGGINLGRFKAGARPETTHVFGWPMNNYWTTNFNADQTGGHSWSYQITSQNNSSNISATHFGWNTRTPFLTRILPGGGPGDKVWQNKIIKGWPANIVLISFIPDQNKKCARVHLREVAGIKTKFSLINNLTQKPFVIKNINILGELLSDQKNIINPFESRFFKIVW